MLLLLLCAGSLMIILDGSVVTVALPTIQRDLAFTPAGLAWVVNAYLIPFGGLLLLAGRLGDLLGRRRVLLAGLALFTLASLLCGLATRPDALIAARFAQGAGGALATAVSLGMIAVRYPEPADRARAMGIFAFTGAAGASLGTLLGGVLTQAANWHWIFFVNVPIGAAIVLLATRWVPADARTTPAAGDADVLGAALVTAGLTLTVYTLVTVESHGWLSGRTLGSGALSAALLGGFVARQATTHRPLLPLRIFRRRAVSAANAAMLLLVAGMFAFQFLGALYLQRVLGLDAARTGLAFLPVPLTIAYVSLRVAPRLVTRFGARTTLIGGLAVIAPGLALLARVPATGSYPVDFLPAVLLMALGFGAAMPAVTMLAMTGVPAGDTGVASGLVNTAQQVGGTLGLAVLATLAAARTNHLHQAGAPPTEALTGGYRLAFTIGVGFVLAAIAAATAAPATARRRERQLSPTRSS
ncbi:DHA2 family efflux MFS transporter permease subunit [Rhizomonospora bruguierae]|uniref:DHA2 family efflux MFS transporter permease subunit n=1 Tax=Rhizomonospora bruguierae TaxID=1581705 RepID=UPI001BCBD405|nr:DHA2 family efflux MFS transporter permease subunit [Micromonospora sp. NBRC 107566]